MEFSPQINAILDDLTSLCCDAIESGGTLNDERAQSLAANLSTNGWERHTTDLPPLSVILKDRIRESCPEPAIHRGAVIDGIVSEVEAFYTNAARFRASSPDNKNDSQAMSPRSTGLE
jgi:hypothetical protein